MSTLHLITKSFDSKYHHTRQLRRAITTTFCGGQWLSGLISVINVRKPQLRVCFVSRHAFLHIWTKLHDERQPQGVVITFLHQKYIWDGVYVHFWMSVGGWFMKNSSHLILLKIAQMDDKFPLYADMKIPMALSTDPKMAVKFSMENL